MNAIFAYQDGHLHAEEVALAEIAAAVGTPFYCYATAAIEETYGRFAAALGDTAALICYSLKANANLAVVRSLARLGAGADVVSEGELRVALAAGVAPERIVFAGVGKTPDELAAALDAGILQINVESLAELEVLARLAGERSREAPVALRVNPDVDAETHAKITTGQAENKFGIDIGQAREIAARAAALPGIRLEGLAVHIGSQLTGLAPFRAAFERLAALYGELKAAGHDLKRLDLGGGLGIAYRDEAPPDIADYVAMARQVTDGLEARLIFEPGRLMVGNAGLLITRVLYVKDGAERRFLIVDAAMNDLIRPSLYDAWHDIVPLAEPAPGTAQHLVDIVGPVCESGDTFARERPLPPMAPGELLAICSTGAYSACMASSYNMRRPAPEVLVRGARFAVVRPRLEYDDMIGRDRLPDWLIEDDRPASRGAA